MKYIDEFRDKEVAKGVIAEIKRTVEEIKQNPEIKLPIRIMEICGGQTHSILQYGIHSALPEEVEFVHGPGCPVCVTPIETINLALELAKQPNVIFTSFGDMLRVPGSDENMFEAKAKGADIRWVRYSPTEAVEIAKQNPDKEVIFFAIGFETTTAPITAALHRAETDGVKNFSILPAMVRVPPALEVILSDPECVVDGILAAGHVCTVMGTEEYEPLVQKYGVPIVVTGFQPVDILNGTLMVLKQLRDGRSEIENAYGWVARASGNTVAKTLIDKYFKIIDRKWRGIGTIPNSGFGLRDEYLHYDAELKWKNIDARKEPEPNAYCGLVLMGKIKPTECPFFRKECSQEHPIGALMVSSEGACAAYFLYQQDISPSTSSGQGETK
ncbi:MAG: hydrogenase formation protein HypD [Candidatus Paceibacterota bacterium]|jgi:hydrogenase expression/formation protein HypD|nr:hydrogenase formation protein HypD [Candidatus Paceibacterota bacterium]